MKIILSLTNAPYKKKWSQQTAEQIAAILKKTETILPSVHFWGSFGKKRKNLTDIADLPATIFKIKTGIYILSNAESAAGETELHLSFKKGAISFQVYRDIEPQQLFEETALLQQYFLFLYAALKAQIDLPLVSSISLPEVDYAKPRPPKLWRVFDPWGIVDFINPAQIDFPDVTQITQRLQKGPLPKGVKREQVDDHLVIINWTKITPEEGDLDKKLTERAVWYHENSEFENDPSYNEHGDVRVDIFENKKKDDYTFYDALTKTGYKAIGFDPQTNTFEENMLKKLQKILQGTPKTASQEVAEIYVIVNKREYAIMVEKAAREYQLSGVLYADDHGQLWNPFPPGLWLT